MSNTVKYQLEQIRKFGINNLYDVKAVVSFAKALNYEELAEFISENVLRYFELLLD